SITGEIACIGNIGMVKIGHNLQGGSGGSSGSITSSGNLAGVSIGGSVSGDGPYSGEIFTQGDMGVISIAHDLLGGRGVFAGSIVGNAGDGTPGNFSPVIITARGQALYSPGIDLAIGHLTVGGRVEFANILAGYQTDMGSVNGDAQIGAVKVGGDWVASNLVA